MFSPFRKNNILLRATRYKAYNSKMGNKNFYKGRGAPSSGSHTKYRGQYNINSRKVFNNTFDAPDLTDFKLKAYVDKNAPEL